MNGARLLTRYLAAGVKAQMQYPASTVLLAVGQFAANIIDVIAIWALFRRFGSVYGWRFGDVAMFYGIVSVSFSVADFLSRGFDVLGAEFLKTGNFDRLLLRPRTLALQLIGHDFRLSRSGRFLQAVVVLVIGVRSLHVQWHAATVALGLWTVAGGIALFFGVMVFQGATTFWTIESIEAMNVLTYGGVQAAQFPLSIYAPWFRDILIFVVPVGCVAYFPVLAILGKPDPLGAPSWLLPLTPIAGFLFLGLAFAAWRAGVAKYASTGS